jgi:hypothetical protein
MASNPDKTGFNVDSFTVSIPVGITFLLLSIALFQFKNSIYGFNLIFWIAIPVFAFIISFITNLSTQYASCKTINAGKSALGSIPSFIAIIIGLLISSFTICRMPIASVFAPLLMDTSIDIVANKGSRQKNNTTVLKSMNSTRECCTPKITLETVENNFPLIAGLSHGFYLMFSMFFGVVIGNNIANVC